MTIAERRIEVPDRPGLGVTLDEGFREEVLVGVARVRGALWVLLVFLPIGTVTLGESRA